MKTLLLTCCMVVAIGVSLASAQDDPYFGSRVPPSSPTSPAFKPPPFSTESKLRPVSYFITTADDFVVEVYHNGSAVPADQREMLREVFGATAEKVAINFKPGDWVVFNVVNNRLRWGGCSYFGVAGMVSPTEAAFVSRAGDPRWSSCDDPGKVADFIASADRKGEPVQKIANPWGGGEEVMKGSAFGDWNGEPIWGKASNTWIKFVYR